VDVVGGGSGGAHPYSGQIDDGTALTISTYWACVSLIADDLAAVPWRAMLKDGESRRIEEENNADWLLHRQANPEMTAFAFRQLLMSWVLTRGNGYAEIERDMAGRPVWLWPVEPWRVRPVRNAAGDLYYEVRNFTREPEYFPADDMLHFKGLGDGLLGYSVLEAAARTLRLALGQDRYAADTADPSKQTQVGGVLETDRRLDDAARKRLREDFDKKHKGKPGSIPILEEGLKYTPHKLVSPHDLQMIESQKWTAENICRWFKVPPHKVGLLDRSTNNNIEHQGIEYVVTGLVPWAVRNEQEADLKLYGPRQMITRYTKYNLASLMRGDSKARAEFYDRMIRNGIMNINEVRAFEDLNPVQHGTTFFVPAQWNTLERAAKGEPVAVDPEPTPAPEPKPREGQPANDPPAKDRGADGESLRPLVLDIARRVVRREAHRLSDTRKRHGLGTEATAKAVGEFADEHQGHVRQALAPLLEAVGLTGEPAATVADLEAAAEVAAFRLAADALAELPEDLAAAWEAERAAPLADRWLGRGRLAARLTRGNAG
jgi:HK97 family phage portal protein